MAMVLGPPVKPLTAAFNDPGFPSASEDAIFNAPVIRFLT
jgi:hypothetical protein